MTVNHRPVEHRLHLDAHQIRQVYAVLRQHAMGVEVWAYGSRVHGERLKPFSDLDLVLIGNRRLTTSELCRITQAFDDSDLTIKVDISDWLALSPEFRQNISRARLQLDYIEQQ